MVVQTLHHAGSTLSLHTIDLDLGVERLDGKRHTRNQSAAAHRHHDSLHLGQLVQNLQANRPLTGNHVLVVERMYKGIAVLVAQLQCPLISIIVDSRHQTHLSAQSLGSLHLRYRSALGQTYQALHTHDSSTERHTLGMVARRTGYYTLCLLFWSELRNLVVSTTNLKRSRLLQTFRLQKHITLWVDSRSVNQLSLSNHFAQHEASLVEIVQL